MWRRALWAGRRILPYIRTAAPVTLALGVGLLLAATWWLGPRWEVNGGYPLASWQMRTLVTLGVVLILMVLWGWTLSRRLGQVKRTHKDEEQVQEDPLLAFERRQQRQFDQCLATIRENLPGRNGVYRLPWYLVMGLEDAGKTSLVQRSGQTYTLSNVTRSPRAERNTKGFEWWIGDQGVLIDPHGDLIAQGFRENGSGADMERRLWLHFVQWLEENRPRRPLSGVIMAVDLARLSTDTQEQRQQHAVALRTRLRELMEKSGSRLPVYISFTKIDLLYGFAGFFRSLSKAEREQPFGFTFSTDNLRDPDSWLDRFDEEYERLVAVINQRLPGVLAGTRDSEERAAAYSFSRQVAGLKPVLRDFLLDMLSADAFSTPALVRGTYFTSVFQEGVPEDAFVTAAAASYGLSGPTQPAQRGGQSVSYFTQRLFPDIIYPEAGLAGDNLRLVQGRQRRVALATSIALVAGLGMAAGWQHYFLKNVEAAEQVEDSVRHFVDNWQPVAYEPDTTGRNLLEPLDRLWQATRAFGDHREQWPVVADMGLYKGADIGPQVEAAYLDMLAYQFIPALMLGIMDAMSQSADDSSERLRHLRVLRMLYDGSGRRHDIVDTYMTRYWQERFPGQREVQERLHRHLDYGLEYTDLAARVDNGDTSADMTLAPFRSSVRWAQQELGRVPTGERVYRDLEQGADPDLQAPYDLAREAGPAFGAVFVRLDQHGEPVAEDDAMANDPLRIPGMLTRKGLEGYFLKVSDEVTELALIDAWVLGRRQDVDFSEADEAQLQARLQDLYSERYTAAWRQAISRLDVHRFRDINHGTRILESLTGGHEPLRQLLRAVARNTALTPELEGPEEAADRLRRTSPRFRLGQDIDRQFAGLNQLVRERGEDGSGLDQIMAVLTSLHEYMRGIQEAPDTGKAALTIARSRMELEGADPIFTLQRLARYQPAPLDRMLRKLADESWRVILNQAVAQLERQWYQEVYQPFQQNLARHYPFVPSAGRDAALQDFEAFFAPQGILDSFYRENLKLFVEDRPEHLNLSRHANLVRADVMEALERAEKIRRAYFTRGGALDVEFALEPLNLSANKRRSVVNVDGQLVEFSHGPRQSIPLVWPNTLRDSVESRITMVPTELNRSPRSLSASGPWALFRLLDKADINGVSARTVDVRFHLDGGDMRYRLHAGSNVNPFTQNLLGGFEIPRSLY